MEKAKEPHQSPQKQTNMYLKWRSWGKNDPRNLLSLINQNGLFFLLNPREPQTLCLWPQACGYYHSVGTISNLRALEEGVADYTGSGVSCQDKCAIRF